MFLKARAVIDADLSIELKPQEQMTEMLMKHFVSQKLVLIGQIP